MTLVTRKNGKICRKEYQTQYNMNRAARKAIKEGADFIAKAYENGDEYIYNARTKMFDKTK